jgi:release factor glutamine methyltransferase
MTLHEAQQQLLFQLYHIYSNEEAKNIAGMVMEHITGWQRFDRVMNKSLKLLPDAIEKLEQYTRDLLLHKPVQYVLHEAWFAGMKLYVDENVLIPRPETEELVDWMIKDIQELNLQKTELTILDVGTGSGCIPLALKKNLPASHVHAIDINEGALEIARKNSDQLQLAIHLSRTDIFSEEQTALLPIFDFIASNPPYIPIADKESIHPNVLQYEPWLALFVQNDDPLSFYAAISSFGHTHLSPNGFIYVEIHEDSAQKVIELFRNDRYENIELRKDMQGKDRMLRVKKYA